MWLTGMVSPWQQLLTKIRSQSVTVLGPIQVLNVLNHVVLYEAFILSLIFNLYKMRIPTKSAVKLI